MNVTKIKIVVIIFISIISILLIWKFFNNYVYRSKASVTTAGPAPYPYRSIYRLKDFQPYSTAEYQNTDRNNIISNNAGGIATNIEWGYWQPNGPSATFRTECAANETLYDGQCFTINQQEDDVIRQYSSKGLRVTGVLYNTPAWARANCNIGEAIYSGIFCKPENTADFARFAGMIAKRYNGLLGNGRIANFVILNEVNSSVWFDTNCYLSSHSCVVRDWVQAYANIYNSAYDKIISEQSTAKVLLSFTNDFDSSLDVMVKKEGPHGILYPTISVKTFLGEFANWVGSRAWSIAYHPYTRDYYYYQDFSQNDLPYVTFGNLGVLAGWLRATFSNTPSAWEVHLTESAINESPLNPATGQTSTTQNADTQEDWLCNSFRNVLGTPGIETYAYFPLEDIQDLMNAHLYLGLIRSPRTGTNSDYKPAWGTWALANRMDLDPPQLNCGFEELPYIKLERAFKRATFTHWASSRLLLPASEFDIENFWRLLRYPYQETKMLYECKTGENGNFISTEVNCEGQQIMGPVGYVYNNPVPGTVALYRCYSQSNGDHMISTEPGCEGYTTEGLLGYALPGNSTPIPRCSVDWNFTQPISANTNMTITVTKKNSDIGWNDFSLYVDGQKQSGGPDSWNIDSSDAGRHFLEFRVNDYSGYGVSLGLWPDITCSPMKSFDSTAILPTSTPVPTSIPTSTSVPIPPTSTPIPTAIPTSIPTSIPTATSTPISTSTPTAIPLTNTPTPIPCRKSQGDANCDTTINSSDFDVWWGEFSGQSTAKDADFNSDGKIDLIDFEIWRANYLK